MGPAEKRGELRLVGTPIGNLEDLSPRALTALRTADAILCEDTRVTAKLAARFGLTAPRISCPAPRERSRVGELLRRLAAGEALALVSDAGMPLLSDPGEHLVAAAAAAGYPVRVVPGPSAPAAALAISGLPAVPHVFLGFLPARSGERRRFLESHRERPETLVWFEAPHRLAESLADAARILGGRRACVARELTKVHEEAARGSLPELAALFRARGRTRGESTVVVEGLREDPRPEEPDPGRSTGRSKRRSWRGETSAPSPASSRARQDVPSRQIYARAVALARERAGNR